MRKQRNIILHRSVIKQFSYEERIQQSRLKALETTRIRGSYRSHEYEALQNNYMLFRIRNESRTKGRRIALV